MAMRGRQTFVLLDDVVVDTNGTPIDLQVFNDIPYGTVQVSISGTASVTIEGRTSPQMPWHVIETFVSVGSNSTRITPFPQMRAVSSGMVGASVRAEASF